MNYRTFCLALFLVVSWAHSGDNRVLVWADEFDGVTIDPSKWSWDTAGNAWGWGNQEDQYYTYERSENARLEEGMLKIEARRESMGGKAFTSARLRTAGKAFWQHGSFEIRAKLPSSSSTKGTWPAIWILPEHSLYGAWPWSGEIDIMEQVGYDPDVSHANTHTKDANHVDGTVQSGTLNIPGLPDDFHVWRMDWTPDTLLFYLDGQKIHSLTADNNSWTSWPFNQPFHMILNLAVGGTWGAVNGIDSAAFPHIFEVDYVRVYRFDRSDYKVGLSYYGKSGKLEYLQFGEVRLGYVG